MNGFFMQKFSSIKNRSMRRLLLSQLLSQTGGYIQNVAMSALITERTGSRIRLGLFLCVSYAPVFLFSFAAAKIYKKVKPRGLLAATELLLFVLSCVLTVLADMRFYGYLVFGAVWGTVRAFQAPAVPATVKLLCKDGALRSGVSMLTLALSLSRAAGPLISGALYTALGYRAAFAANAISYIPSVILLMGLDVPAVHESRERGNEKPRLPIALLLTVFTVSLAGTAYNIMFTGITQKLGLGGMWFSLFMAAVGAGAVVGTFSLQLVKKPYIASFGIALCALALSLCPNGAAAAAVCVLYGACDYLFFTLSLTLLQKQNSTNSVASAMAAYTAVTTGALPLGFLLLGWLSAVSDIGTLLAVISGIIAIMSVFFKVKFVDI